MKTPKKVVIQSDNVDGVTSPMKPRDRTNIMFKTLCNRDVCLQDLVRLNVVPEKVASDLEKDRVTLEQVKNDCRMPLFGIPSIGGVLVEETGEKLSFLEAAKRNLLSPVEAYHYLEAQACTGGIINPKNGENFSVLDAYMSGLIERSQVTDLQKAEETVVGHSKRGVIYNLSLAEMLEQDILSMEQARRYLHCQLATGGVIDAKLGIRLIEGSSFIQASVGRSLIPSLSAEDNPGRFLDPSSNSRKTYIELVQSSKVDPLTSVSLLLYTGSKSKIITETTTITTTTKYKIKKRSDVFFNTTLNRKTSLIDLLEAGIVTEETVAAIERGQVSEEEIAQSIKQYLVGEQPIAGILVEATGQKCGILECVRNGVLKRGTGLELLEAQAATGCILDPITGERYDVKGALEHDIIDATQMDAMERAMRAVTGYRDPVTGHTLSLFEAMKKGYVTESRGIRLLEAQIATGGLIDPNVNHRVPISVAHQRGIINKKMFRVLTDPSDDTKGFFDPNTNDNLTYLELISRCQTEKETGLVYFPLEQKKPKKHKHKSSSQRKKRTTRSRKIVIIDPDTKAELSVKEALEKNLIDKETAQQLLAQEGEWTENAKSGDTPSAPTEVTSPLQTLSRDASTLATKPPLPHDQNGNVPKDTFGDNVSARLFQVSTALCEPIAGIIDVKKGERISIKEAEKRRLVDRTSAQRLYEAQAATGGIININDSTKRRCTLNEAISAGLIERRLAQRIESAEKAFVGFVNLRTKELLSLGQALKKGLCYYESGSRCMEYQCATGGLVDPASGSRVSLDESLSLGWIDERTCERLKNLNRFSKSVVDLKTNLLVTYPDALKKSVIDSTTGHRLLEAYPRTERSLQVGSGVTVQASSLYGSLTSSLSSSLAGSPTGSSHNSRRGSFDEDSSLVRSPTRT